MKFVNKLSVISLIVLMFSFINVAQAADCSGTGVKSCDQSKTESTCGTTYRTTAPSYQCKWDGSTCRATGNSCGTNSNSSGKVKPGGSCTKNNDCLYYNPGCQGGKCIEPCTTCEYGGA